MATASDILLATELTSILNGQEFSLSFTAERVYSPDWDQKTELQTLRVGIWPGEAASEPFERIQLKKTYQAGITFAKNLSAVPITDIDFLCNLVTEVQELLELGTIDLGNGSHVINRSWDYVLRFDETLLDRHKGADGIVKYTGLFASIITFQYELLR